MDFVLDPFAKREADDVEVLIEDGADAVLSLVHDGLTPTQSRFNRGEAREPSHSREPPPTPPGHRTLAYQRGWVPWDEDRPT